MTFREQVNRNLQNAPQEAEERARQEVIQAATNVCQGIETRILLASKYHTNSRIPFQAEYRLICYFYNAYLTQEGIPQRGFFQQRTRVNTITLRPEIREKMKLIRELLAKDGIRASAWELYKEDYGLDEQIVLAKYPFTPFELHNPINQTFTRLPIDPFKTITETVIEDRGFGGTSYQYRYSQNGKACGSYNRRPMMLMMSVTYDG